MWLGNVKCSTSRLKTCLVFRYYNCINFLKNYKTEKKRYFDTKEGVLFSNFLFENSPLFETP